MELLSYRQFVDEINNGKIIKAVFQIENYPHYNNCLIERAIDNFNIGKSTAPFDYISVRLTKDSEHFSFGNAFNEKIKLFDMKLKGKFTLEQMWNRIKFIKIDYAAKD